MMKEIPDRHNDIWYETRKRSSINDNVQNSINVNGLTKPAYVQLRCGGTIARIVWYVDHKKHYIYGNVVLRDVHANTEKPTFYIYAQNRLIRVDTEHNKRSSYEVRQFVLMMDYCQYPSGDELIKEYDKIRKESYQTKK